MATKLTRREVLKLAAASVAGAFLASCAPKSPESSSGAAPTEESMVQDRT